MPLYEFAIEKGFHFEYKEVRGDNEKQARETLWNEVLFDAEKDNVSSIECTGESAMITKDHFGNVVLQDGFKQVAVWRGTLVEGDVEGFTRFMLEDLNVRVQYLEEFKTFPSIDRHGAPIPGTGGRNDVLFAVHDDDVGTFAIKRLSLQDTPSWIEDIFANGHGVLYEPRIAKYQCWDATSPESDFTDLEDSED